MIQYVCFVNDTWTNETYTYCHTRYRHDALPISQFCLKEGGEVSTPCYRRGLGTHVRGGATQPLLIRVRLDGSEIGPRRLRSGADMHLPAKHVAARARIRRSEEHTSELQSLMRISYAVFCLKKKKITHNTSNTNTP